MYTYKMTCITSENGDSYNATVHADEMVEEEDFIEFYRDGELTAMIAKRMVFFMGITEEDQSATQ